MMSLSLPVAFMAPGALFGIDLGSGSRSGSDMTAPLQIVLLLTALTLLPAILMSITPFLRITLVLHFLRQALGTQTAPSNQVLLGIALFLTMALMRPTASEMLEQGWAPYQEGRISREQAWQRGTDPLRRHLLRFAREKDLALMVEISHRPSPARPSDMGLELLVPAYVLSELKAGFQIGAVLFLPFLIIDLVVASVTLSMGMVQLPPVMISAPFKILLFVLADGWHLVVGGLLRSFAS